MSLLHDFTRIGLTLHYMFLLHLFTTCLYSHWPRSLLHVFITSLYYISLLQIFTTFHFHWYRSLLHLFTISLYYISLLHLFTACHSLFTATPPPLSVCVCLYLGVTLIGLALQRHSPTQPPRARRPAAAGDEDGAGRAEGGLAKDSDDACKGCTVLVKGGGELTLEHCHVMNGKGVCICVSGSASAVTAKMCKVEQGAAGGVLFEKGAGGYLCESDICACSQFGVLVTSGAEPVISACQIHDGTAEGIIFQEANGLVSDCDIFKNAGVGICITQGSDPRVEQASASEKSAVRCSGVM